ncbi:hypothetical protein RI054_19g87180 [Pseudoscourfieldia marina]
MSAPIPVRRLLLTVKFKCAASSVSSLPASELHEKHAQCVRVAAESSQLIKPDDVVGAAVIAKGNKALDIQEAQDVSYDAALLGDKAAAISYVYASGDGHGDPAMVMRVVVALAKMDGVTALRVGLHALELVAGGPMSEPGKFAAPPPYTYGIRQMLNFGRMLARTLSKIAGAKLLGHLFDKTGAAKRIDAPEGTVVPNNATSMLAYYAQKAPPPASYRLFAATGETAKLKPYRRFLATLEQWKDKLGLRAVFVLINASPFAIPAEVPNCVDIADDRDYALRYGGAFDKAVNPPGEDIWPVNNFYHSDMIFINNYGRHDMDFKGMYTPTAFKWDWIGMAAHVWGAGCLQLNGKFMAWVRGTKEGVDAVDDAMATAVGAKVGSLYQVRREVFDSA